jgi:hypothetical protein
MKVNPYILMLCIGLTLAACFTTLLIAMNSNKQQIRLLDSEITEIKNQSKIESLEDSIASLYNQRQLGLITIHKLDSVASVIETRIANLTPEVNYYNYEISRITPTYLDSADAAIRSRLLELLDTVEQLRLSTPN